MRIADLPLPRITASLAQIGLGLDLGAAKVRIRGALPELVPMLQCVYGGYRVADPDGFFDVTAHVRPVGGLRALVAPQIELWIDGAAEFERFPRDTPLPLLEWGINYALASRLCCYLLLHAGAVERGGNGVLLPAMPGSGKSTLTAALSRRGFRLLSDEFGVVSFDRGQLLAMLRPVALKNQSIDVIRSFDPSVTIGPSFPRTRKGTVAHLAPTADDAAAVQVPATPRLIVFPLYRPDISGVQVERVPAGRSFARLAVNSFNFDLLGPEGFDLLVDLVRRCDAYTLEYQSLDEAVDAVTSLLTDASDAP